MRTVKRISPERKKLLWPLLESGSQTAAEEVTAGHLGLSLSIARRYKTLQDEAESIALEVLWHCVKKVQDGEKKIDPDQFPSWLCNCIRRKCHDASKQLEPVGPAGRTQRKHNISSMTRVSEDVPYVNQNTSELLEHIVSLCVNAEEEAAVRLRANGYTFSEIAKRLRVSEAHVHNIVNGIEKRYDNSST